MSEAYDKNLRRAVEFILKVKTVYSQADVLRFDWRVFFEVLQEAEAEMQEQINKSKEK